MYHALLLTSLWLVVIVASEPQMKEFLQWFFKVRDFFRHRHHLKSVLANFQMQYEQAATDYLRGYYYGKIRMTEMELEEMWK